MKKLLTISLAIATVFLSCTKSNLAPAEQLQSRETAKSNLQMSAALPSVSFLNLHPCGIAVSKSGKVALCTYEGDNALGTVKVWNSFQNFLNGTASNATYTLKDPEAVAFDNNEALFISCTVPNRIYYTSKPLIKPTLYITTPGNIYNPRGIAFDSKNNLVAVYEGLGVGTPSAVYMFSNPLLSIGQPSSKLLNNITDPKNPLYFNGQLMGVSLAPGNLGSMLIYLTELNKGGSGVLHRFTYFTYGWMGGTGVHLKLDGLAMDVAASGNDIYYTTLKNYTSGNLNSSLAPSLSTQTQLQYICPFRDPYTAWGVATYQNYTLVADAPQNTVKVFTK